jgi:HSP20 family molecular chaperone IbpA
MMQRLPRSFHRAAAVATATVLRPTTAAVPRALQTITPQATQRPLFLAHGRARAFSTTPTYHHRNDDVDIMELPGGYSYVFEVPGFGARNLRVQMVPANRTIRVIGERCEEDAGPCRYLRKERSIGKLEQVFCLPLDADMGRVSAMCRDGLLTVTIQKLPSPPLPFGSPRNIQVLSDPASYDADYSDY